MVLFAYRTFLFTFNMPLAKNLKNGWGWNPEKAKDFLLEPASFSHRTIVLSLDENKIISTLANSKVCDKFLLRLKINHEPFHISAILSNMAFA